MPIHPLTVVKRGNDYSQSIPLHCKNEARLRIPIAILIVSLRRKTIDHGLNVIGG